MRFPRSLPHRISCSRAVQLTPYLYGPKRASFVIAALPLDEARTQTSVVAGNGQLGGSDSTDDGDAIWTALTLCTIKNKTCTHSLVVQ